MEFILPSKPKTQRIRNISDSVAMFILILKVLKNNPLFPKSIDIVLLASKPF